MSDAKPAVSFTIRRPTPVSRQGSSGPDSDREGFKVPHLPRHVSESGRSTPKSPLATNGSRKIRTKVQHDHTIDSSDEEEGAVDEIVTGFDQFGVQRLHEKKKKEGPLVIAPLKNRDWREVARKRKAADIYVPEGAKAVIGEDGSVGGLGTRDTLNSGPELAGLVQTEKKMKMEVDEIEVTVTPPDEDTEMPEETEDEKARRALLAVANGEDTGYVPSIEVIANAGNNFRSTSEEDAYKRDMEELPEMSTLSDYERVPVADFGAALLRGMGWKPGQAASRTRTGPVEPYLPSARPALLGIGAKEREALDDGSKKPKGHKSRPERKYVPVIKREKTKEDSLRAGSPPRRSSAPSSRRSSPDRRDRDKDREHNRDRDDDYRRRKEHDRDYDSDRGSRRERDSDRRKDRNKDDRRDRDRARDSDRDRDRRRD